MNTDVQNIRKQTLETLQTAVIRMMSLEWNLKIDALPRSEQARASVLLWETNSARLRLENRALQDIAAALKSNEVSLAKSRDRVSAALADLNKVSTVLSAINGLLKIVAKFI